MIAHCSTCICFEWLYSNISISISIKFLLTNKTDILFTLQMIARESHCNIKDFHVLSYFLIPNSAFYSFRIEIPAKDRSVENTQNKISGLIKSYQKMEGETCLTQPSIGFSVMQFPTKTRNVLELLILKDHKQIYSTTEIKFQAIQFSITSIFFKLP